MTVRCCDDFCNYLAWAFTYVRSVNPHTNDAFEVHITISFFQRNKMRLPEAAGGPWMESVTAGARM